MHIKLRSLLGEALIIDQHQLLRLISRAPNTYKIYEIPKRSGGSRVIAQPARETKILQRWIIENIFSVLPVHECATAYRNGSSIKHNARPHKNNAYLSKYDFKDFFSSITEDDLKRHLPKYLSEILSEDDICDIARICSIKLKNRNALCLSVGAPSSPLLSNTILYEFDVHVSEWCQERKITYTRYADDLAFSTNQMGLSSEIDAFVRKAVNSLEYPRLKINQEKTIHLSKKRQRRITGLIINNDGKISLGRDRKREISALIHKYKKNILSNEKLFLLQGLLGFSKDIEPLFIARMRSKYGTEIIDRIFQIRKPPNPSFSLDDMY